MTRYSVWLTNGKSAEWHENDGQRNTQVSVIDKDGNTTLCVEVSVDSIRKIVRDLGGTVINMDDVRRFMESGLRW
jgi:hypothetical protein